MRKKLLVFLMIAVLAISCCGTAFAAAGGDGLVEVEPESTHSVAFTIDRFSSTKADVTIDVEFNTIVDDYRVSFTLQKWQNGSWVNDMNNDDYKIIYNGKDEDYFFFSHTYDDLKRGVTYRIQCKSEDEVNGNSHTFTAYSHSF